MSDSIMQPKQGFDAENVQTETYNNSIDNVVTAQNYIQTTRDISIRLQSRNQGISVSDSIPYKVKNHGRFVVAYTCQF